MSLEAAVAWRLALPNAAAATAVGIEGAAYYETARMNRKFLVLDLRIDYLEFRYSLTYIPFRIHLFCRRCLSELF